MDAEFFGKQIALSLGTEPVAKHQQIGEQQFSDGNELVQLMDVSEGSTETSGQTYGNSTGTGLTDSLAEAVRNASDDFSSEPNRTTSSGNSSSQSESNSQHSSNSRSRSVTHKQTLVAKTIIKRVIQSTQFYSSDEIDRHAAHLLKCLQIGECVMIIDGGGDPMRCQTPEAKAPFSKAPKYAADLVRRWLDKMAEHPMFATPELMLKEREKFLDRLLIELQKMDVRKLEAPFGSPRLSVTDIPLQIVTPKEQPDDLVL